MWLEDTGGIRIDVWWSSKHKQSLSGDLQTEEVPHHLTDLCSLKTMIPWELRGEWWSAEARQSNGGWEEADNGFWILVLLS